MSAYRGLRVLGRRGVWAVGARRGPGPRAEVEGPGPAGGGGGGGGGGPGGLGFRPSRVAVVAKTTRYEFEQQRYRYADLSEDRLRQLLALKGSSYSGLLERHHIHTKNVEHILDSLRKEGIEVRLVKRREYDEETVRWADAVIAAGGDGTMLLAASKVLDRLKPVIGVNTDPERSEGHLCLPVRYTHSFPEALKRLTHGEFRWLWRQRIRMYLEGTGINTVPVDLHEQQLSLDQHSRALNNARIQDKTKMEDLKTGSSSESEISGPQLLPVRALNEVFIGESLSSRVNYKSCKSSFTFSLHRASYYEISVDDGPWEKQKSSGLNLCTGTGSKAWSYNINRVATQAVEDVLTIAQRQGNLNIPLSRELIEKVTNEYNDSLLYSPEEPKMLFSIREPIANRVFSSSRQRCFSSKVCVRSRCWDACMVIDGGTSFEFNDGAIASIMIDREDELRTVLFEQ
ncbi:NAD kinase 2, mitochondrial [Tachyglossus aculeatus]|uniref:NAD kinase 2, mitochondrial n=1 Tax=Tachyglossus aculeatus TaxID=9261 RepID=UPI0018F725FC|nr:NAD kinase 2, mitochondrial [Tachyglossus aculeatus]